MSEVETPNPFPAPLAAWHRIVAEGDHSLLDDLLAEEVVFHSPVVHTPQRGKAVTRLYLGAAFQVLAGPNFRYRNQVHGESSAFLEFVTEIDGTEINGVDFLRWNESGRLVEFKVWLRPLQAVQLIHRLMAEGLQHAQGRGLEK